MDEVKCSFSSNVDGSGRHPAERTNQAARLGDVVRDLLEDQIRPQQQKFVSIAEVWSQLLPPELDRHCRLENFSGGQLKVLVDSPAYLHELRLCSQQLLAELRKRCRSARIKEIKLAIG